MTSSRIETRTGTTKPTVVLVHGAFADSSSWNGVIARLLRDGYPVIGVANPLRALHSDAEFLRDVLDSVVGPIVLAGHSYGGSVMSEAADGHPQVKALVYVASFLLDEGESTGELAAVSRATSWGRHCARCPSAVLTSGPSTTSTSSRGSSGRSSPATCRRTSPS